MAAQERLAVRHRRFLLPQRAAARAAVLLMAAPAVLLAQPDRQAVMPERSAIQAPEELVLLQRHKAAAQVEIRHIADRAARAVLAVARLRAATEQGMDRAVAAVKAASAAAAALAMAVLAAEAVTVARVLSLLVTRPLIRMQNPPRGRQRIQIPAARKHIHLPAQEALLGKFV